MSGSVAEKDFRYVRNMRVVRVTEARIVGVVAD